MKQTSQHRIDVSVAEDTGAGSGRFVSLKERGVL